jgi:hypothetical protein
VIRTGTALIVYVSPVYAGFDVEIDGNRGPEGSNDSRPRAVPRPAEAEPPR